MEIKISRPKAVDPPESVTKLDAARRQLRSAVRMFFERRDPISIHTLTMAAHGILHDLSKAKGSGSFLKDSDLIRPEGRRAYIRILHEPQNFFKHADKNRDPNEIIEFQPEVTPFFLLDALRMYREVKGRPMREELVFQSWFGIVHPKLMRDTPVTRIFRDKLKGVNPAHRDAFLVVLNEGKYFRGMD